MLTISREVKIKVGRHAWNVYPLEAFGFLLGRSAENTVYAALPSSKTRRWHEFGDRWTGIEENIEKARAVARLFDMEVAGFYASTNAFDPIDRDDFPIPPLIANSSMEVFMLYQAICCPSCSWASFKCGNRWLKDGEDYVVPRGKRIDDSINQKRILTEWRKVFGAADYSNLSADR
ncbi:MAG: hypothetical protein U1C96_02335 [Gallionella sp.]|nr:hypothetical protein [Gallionella sp.]